MMRFLAWKLEGGLGILHLHHFPWLQQSEHPEQVRVLANVNNIGIIMHNLSSAGPTFSSPHSPSFSSSSSSPLPWDGTWAGDWRILLQMTIYNWTWMRLAFCVITNPLLDALELILTFFFPRGLEYLSFTGVWWTSTSIGSSRNQLWSKWLICSYIYHWLY